MEQVFVTREDPVFARTLDTANFCRLNVWNSVSANCVPFGMIWNSRQLQCDTVSTPGVAREFNQIESLVLLYFMTLSSFFRTSWCSIRLHWFFSFHSSSVPLSLFLSPSLYLSLSSLSYSRNLEPFVTDTRHASFNPTLLITMSCFVLIVLFELRNGRRTRARIITRKWEEDDGLGDRLWILRNYWKSRSVHSGEWAQSWKNV